MKLNRKDEEMGKLQAEVQRLANAPVVEILIRLDGRTGEVDCASWGNKITYEGVYAMLDEARKIIQEQEIKARLQAQAPAINIPPGGVECAEES